MSRDSKISQVAIGDVTIGPDRPLALIAGPCVIESAEHTLRLATEIASVARAVGLPFIFKASFDKANRSSNTSFRGPGLKAGLEILAGVRRELGVPVISDIHAPEQCAPASEALDALQVPAFLCRQTDLLVAAAKTGRPVNVKKGQFMSPEEMDNVVDKLRGAGCSNVLLTERGTFFGYHLLVNDMTGIPKMQRYAPVVFDATHSCQFPGGQGDMTGGQREYAGTLARAAVAAGTDALFIEVHDQPDQARSDAATVLSIPQLRTVLAQCARIHAVLHGGV